MEKFHRNQKERSLASYESQDEPKSGSVLSGFPRLTDLSGSGDDLAPCRDRFCVVEELFVKECFYHNQEKGDEP